MVPILTFIGIGRIDKGLGSLQNRRTCTPTIV